MSRSKGFIVALTILVMMTAPATAGAQDLNRLAVKAGQRVQITLTDGTTVKGKVRGLTAAAIEVQVGQERARIAAADVRRIRVHDPLDGVGKGAKVALPISLIWLLPGKDDFDLLTRSERGLSPIRALATIVAGAVIGGVLDAATLTTVYFRSSREMSVSVRPLVSAAGKGVGIRLRW